MDLSGVEVVKLLPEQAVTDYHAAMQLADTEAWQRLGAYMLLACYDRTGILRLPNIPASATPGYVDYGLSHGASLMVDIEDGRFVFFYLSPGEA